MSRPSMQTAPKPATTGRYIAFRRNMDRTNEALVGLLLASRLGLRQLEEKRDSGQAMDEFRSVYPGIESWKTNLLNPGAADMIRLGERYFPLIAIPTYFSIYHEHLSQLHQLLRDNGLVPKVQNSGQLELTRIHADLATASPTHLTLPEHLAELVDLTRLIRNRIAHHAGTDSAGVVGAYGRKSQPAKAFWLRYAGRALERDRETSELQLGPRETIAVLHVLRSAFDHYSCQADVALPREWLAREAIESYLEALPDKRRASAPRDRGRFLKLLAGLARRKFARVGLTEEELAAALTDYLATHPLPPKVSGKQRR
jgi:hypothetical protein